MSGERRVVVTGIGMVTPLGESFAATREALRRGTCAGAPAASFDASAFGDPLTAEAARFDARAHFRVTKALKVSSDATRFAVAASQMALADAAWPRHEASREMLGVVIGSSSFDFKAEEIARAIGDDEEARAVHDIPYFAERILSRLNPLWLLVTLPNMASAQVAIQVEAHGPNSTIMTDWIAGLQAIGEAADWIRAGEADAVLAGGSERVVFAHAVGSYEQAGLIAPRGDSQRAGFVPAEGAAILLLEERTHALARGACIRGEILAYASAAGDAPNDDAPASGSALHRTLTAAMADAGWRAADVSAIGAAAVFAKPFGDSEARAIDEVFGDAGPRPRRMEFKSRLGHAFGASGAIDAALMLDACAAEEGGLLCNALGFSGAAATLAFVGAGRATRDA